jgi:hypothetical protein
LFGVIIIEALGIELFAGTAAKFIPIVLFEQRAMGNR